MTTAILNQLSSVGTVLRSAYDTVSNTATPTKLVKMCLPREIGYSKTTYSTYRVVITSRHKAPKHLVALDNLKAFLKYSERSVQNI